MSEGFPLLPSGHIVFSPPEEFDLATVPDVESELRHLLELHRWVVIDLSEVTFIDSSGLSALIWARQESLKLGGEVVVVGPSRRTLRLLEITKLSDVFPLYDSLDDVPPASAAG
ncbi:MAG TPA: STAS domain-containing protein [Nocardioidaceae bacterium]|nr:STAS domain-containing protein [Nocardioidaceae bacterium]